jgi:hypothetical protein
MIIVQKGSDLALIETIKWELQCMLGIASDSDAWQELLGDEMEGNLCFSYAKDEVFYLSFKREADQKGILFKLVGMSLLAAQKMPSLFQKVHNAS